MIGDLLKWILRLVVRFPLRFLRMLNECGFKSHDHPFLRMGLGRAPEGLDWGELGPFSVAVRPLATACLAAVDRRRF